MKRTWIISSFVLCMDVLLLATAISDPFDLEASKRVAMTLNLFDNEYKRMWWFQQSAEWNYSINMTFANAEARSSILAIFSDWMKGWKLWARNVPTDYLSPVLKEIVERIASGVVIMDQNEARLISDLRSNLTKILSSASISLQNPAINAQGEGDFSLLMARIRDPELLKKVWISWRQQVGEKSRPLFWTLLTKLNKAAQKNGYNNLGESWTRELGIDNALQVALSLWNEVKDFYAHLHAYTHHKLKSFYGQAFFTDRFIPAHLLGSLWSENWSALIDLLSPFPDKPGYDITKAFRDQNLSVVGLIKKAEGVYTEAGFPPFTASFWKNSMFEKPHFGSIVDCHAASYDLGLFDDFRIRMCGLIHERSFLEAVHEMGHVQYYMAYHHLPMIYRSGANSAFHEAVGETMVYAVQNPECLSSMGLIHSFPLSNGALLNNLMKQALSKFVLLPWALTIEVWRYGLLSGEIKEEDMNHQWWNLRKKFQGVKPPAEEYSDLFDAGTKYHTINNFPYLRYYFSRFLELQFLESLCDIAKEEIHSCCFPKSKLAGRYFRNMLSLGSSVSWQDALNTLTGQRSILSKPLINYYKPLYDWLVDYNRRNNISVTIE